MALNEENNSLTKLAQFYAALREKLDFPYLKRILDQLDNINCQIPTINHIGNHKPELIGSTLLHLARIENNYEIFEYLLDRGIDYTIKNKNGSTVLLQPIESANENSPALQLRTMRNNLNGNYSNLILWAHVNKKNFNNPRNDYGISHFHVACVLNKAQSVEFFLENGVSVDETISSSSPILPGYSPLHLAIASDSSKTVDILLKYGAKVHCKDARGVTPLHILVERRLEIEQHSQNELQMFDDKIQILLKNHSAYKIDDTGFTLLHIACISPLQHFEASIENVNDATETTSPFFPGYTALHFAMLFESHMVTHLLVKGANILSKDANGTTPFDICLDRYPIEKIHSTLSSVPGWNDIFMTDRRTRLLDLVFAMRSVNKFNYIIQRDFYDVNTHVPLTSPLFPGLSTLHLAVIFTDDREPPYRSYSNFCIITTCLHRKAYLFARDSHGSTALHLAFRLRKIHVLDVLLKAMKLSTIPVQYRCFCNVGDIAALSISHIAAAANDLSSVEQLLTVFDLDCPVFSTFKWYNNEWASDDKDKDRPFFVIKGSTLLHIAVATGNIPMTRLLLRNGANVYAKDVNGFTPLHRVLADGHQLIGNEILSTVIDLKDCVVDGANLSHLHVACWLNNVTAVERLANAGSDIHAAVTSSKFSFLTHLDGFTPIHVAMMRGSFDAMRYLLERGADILARKADGSTPLYGNLMGKSISYSRDLLGEIWGKTELLRRIEEDIGLTMLHLACYLIDVQLVRDSLGRDVTKVNSRAHTNSPIWPGWTPLHILIMRCIQVIEDEQVDDFLAIARILTLLLSNGADVTVFDSRCETPLHLANAIMPSPGKWTLPVLPSVAILIADMLSSITNFSVNPRNNRGISLFHIACRVCHVDAMEKYLEKGCEVDQQIDYYSCNRFAGYTPLHLSTSCSLPFERNVKVKALELLLNYGADCDANDIFGNNPLHTAARFNDGSLRENMLRRLIGKGADVNHQNLLGETPFEIVLKSLDVTAEEVKLFLDSGCRANAYNPITALGYLPRTFDNEEIRDILINSSSISEIDYQGRTAFHNIVSTKNPSSITSNEYFAMIQKLIELDCDLDHQDQLGRTALHLAVQFDNHEAVCGLLIAGADINILDATDNPPTSYCSFSPEHSVCEVFLHQPKSEVASTLAFHLHKLRFLNLEVIRQNIEFHDRYCTYMPTNESRVIDFSEEITEVKSLRFGSTSMSLRKLLSESGAVAYIPKCQREDINEFFKTGILQHRFLEMESVLRLQYRKGLKRDNIIEIALHAFWKLEEHLARCPSEVGEMILSHLTNREVDNLIIATEHLE